MAPQVTPIGAVLRGVLAGAAGTAAMDAYWYARYRQGGGDSGPLSYEFVVEEDWDKVSAPGQLGKRLIEAFTRQPLSPRWTSLVNNLMHWGYGIAWGGAYGIVAGSLSEPRTVLGAPFGAGVWLTGYALLPLAKLYKPLWKYDAKTLAGDLAGHLIYGTSSAAVYKRLAPR